MLVNVYDNDSRCYRFYDLATGDAVKPSEAIRHSRICRCFEPKVVKRHKLPKRIVFEPEYPAVYKVKGYLYVY